MGLHRRSLITGLVSLIAAPAIVRASSLMPVKQMVWGVGPQVWLVKGRDAYGRLITEYLDSRNGPGPWQRIFRGETMFRFVDEIVAPALDGSQFSWTRLPVALDCHPLDSVMEGITSDNELVILPKGSHWRRHDLS